MPFFCEKEGSENGFAILSGVTVVTVTLWQKKPVIIHFHTQQIHYAILSLSVTVNPSPLLRQASSPDIFSIRYFEM